MSDKKQLPALPWSGSCQCGQVKYQLKSAPLTLYCCHCTECQKQAASMHGMSMIVNRKDLELTGALNKWSRATDSGNTTDCYFCPDCGSRVYHQGTHRKSPKAVVTIKAGTLDVIRQIEPVGHIWLKSAQSGFHPDPDTIQITGQPENYDQLIKLFCEKYGF